MASIFDYSTYGMSPAEIAAMEAEVQKQRPYINPNKLPSTVNKGMGPVIGDYIPADQPAGSRTAGLLGNDPVSTQYGSRVNPNATSGTMYGGRGGNVSPDIDKARTTPGASTRWVPPGETSLFNSAKSAADWTPPAESHPLLKEAAKGASALSKFAKVAGPAGFVYDAVNPEMLGDSELTPQQQAMMSRNAVQNMGPEKAAEAVQFGSDVAGRTLDAGLGRNQGINLRDPNGDLDSPEDIQAARDALDYQEPQQSPMEPPAVEQTPVGPVARSEPTTVPQAAAKTMADQESQRQVLEQGAIKGLSTGAVSRPEFAEQIVKSDAQKAGVTLTPEQIKKSTAVELTNMKSMSNDDVARYISYALMAAGVLATVFDKTGQAGENFSNSFNKQLDRNLQGGLAMQKARTEAAKQAQALEIANADRAVRQQQADTQAKSVDQTGLYQQGSLEQRREAAQGTLGATYAGINAANSRAAGSQDLQIRRLNQQERQFEIEEAGRNADRTLRRDQYETEADYKAALIQQGRDKNLIAASRAAAQGREAKGIDITTKDAQGLVDAAADSQGLNVSKATKSAIAQTVRVRAKNDPEGFARDPNGVVLQVIKEKSGPYTTGPAGFFTDPTVNQRQLK